MANNPKLNKNDNERCIRHEWKQTESEVTVTIFLGSVSAAKSLKNEDVQVDAEESSLRVTFHDGRVWSRELNHTILPEYVNIQRKANRLQIKMMKTVSGMWFSLESKVKEICIQDAIEETEETMKQVVEGPIQNLENIKHDIYEKTPDSLTLTIYVKSMDKESLDVSFLSESFSIKFNTSDKQFLLANKGTDDTTFIWSIALKAGIQPHRCHYKVSDTKLELFFIKKVPVKWNTLEEVPQKIRVVDVPASTWISAVKDTPDVTNQDSSEVAQTPSPDESKPKVVGYVDKVEKSNINEERRDTQVKPTCMVSPLDPKESPNQVRPGFTGLENLGNTCFMNSVLQCLVNTRELRDYFKESFFQNDINVNNPLGMKGQLALSFAVLVRKLWMGNETSLAPSKLKMLIAKKAMQFSGFAQHDAQEFMAFFLDGLHEDLNRIRDKPYVEIETNENKADEEAAKEAWANYKRRNDSVVVDLFQGQYRSKLVCPICKKVSITFDPFLYLSLPLPKDCITFSVFFFYKDPRPKPIMFKTRCTSGATVHDLLKKVSSKSGVSPVNLHLLVMRHDTLQSIIPSTPLSNVYGISKIFVFEVYDEKHVGEPVVEVMVQQRLLMPPISNICACCNTKDTSADSNKLKRCTRCFKVAYCNVDCQRSHWSTHKSSCQPSRTKVGLPFMFSLPESQTTFRVIYRILEGFSRHSVNVFQPPVSPKARRRSSQPTSPTGNPSSSTENHSSLSGPSSSISNVSNYLTSTQTAPNENSSENLEAEKAMSELNLADMKPDFPVNIAEHPMRMVIGQQPEDYPIKTQFIIQQTDSRGNVQGEELHDQGKEAILSSSCTHLVMDWKNDIHLKDYTLVQSKEMDFEDGTADRDSGDDIDCLDDCLKLYTEPEVLTSKDAWYCPSCKEHREATKQLSLWKLPPLLIVQLKRFSYGGMWHFREKLDKMINFPIRGLDVSPYLCGSQRSNDSLYDLYGVVNHQGGLLGGHYTSYVRTVDMKDSRKSEVDWRLCDDSHVMSIRESCIVSEYAYVLFYRKRGFGQSITSPLTPSLTHSKNNENKNKTRKQLENKLDSCSDMPPLLDSNIVYYAGANDEPFQTENPEN